MFVSVSYVCALTYVTYVLSDMRFCFFVVVVFRVLESVKGFFSCKANTLPRLYR